MLSFMKMSLRMIGLLVVLVQPCIAAAAHVPDTQGMDAENGSEHIEWPSRRALRAAAYNPNPFRPGMITLKDVPLDRTFTDTEYGVKLQYPSSWEVIDARQETPPLTLVVMFLSPEEEEQRGIRQNANLVVEELASELSLPEYTNLGIAMEREFFENYTLVTSENILLAGAYRAHRVVFTAALSGGEMTFEQIWLLRSKTAHVWTFADSAGTFDEHVVTFRKMMDTLTVR